MADPNALADWLNLLKSLIPYLGGGGVTLILYFYFRRIDADNRKLDREKIVQLNEENKELRAEVKEQQDRADALQDKLNNAYKTLYPYRGVNDE